MAGDEGLPYDYDAFGPRWVGHGSEDQDPDTIRARIYEYHKAAGTIGAYYQCYPGDCPWDWGLTPEERAAVLGQSRER